MLLSRQKMMLERTSMNEVLSVYAFLEERGLFELIHDDDKGRTTGYDLAAAWYGFPATGVRDQTIADLEEILAMEFPADTVLQFQKLGSPDIEGTISRYVESKEEHLAFTNNQNDLTDSQKRTLRALVETRAQFLRRGTDEPLIRGTTHTLKEEIVFVSMRVPFKRPPKQADIDKIASIAARMESQLRKVGIGPKRMNPQAYIDTIHAILRMGSDGDKPKYDPERPIRDQATHQEDYMEAEVDYMTVNGRYVRSLSAHNYPTKYHLGRMLSLFGDLMGSNRQVDDPYLATLHIVIPDHFSARQELTKTKGWTDNFNRGQIAKLSSRVRYLAGEHAKMERDIGHEGSVVKIWFNFLTFSKDKQAALDATQNFKAMARGFGWDLRADQRLHHFGLFNALPMNSEPRLVKQLQRYQSKGAIHAVQFLPIMGEWAGNASTPMQVYVSRRGALMSINSWESGVGYNGVIAATTGSGKSFQIMDLAVNMLAAGVKVNLLDKGRSFLKATEVLGGMYFDFDDPGKYNLNPYKQVRNIDEESEQLGIIFQTMADPSMRLTNFQEPVMTKIVREGWEAMGQECSVDWVQQRCLEDEDKRVRDLGVMLDAYTSKGEHGAWFAEGIPLSFNQNALTCIEISTLDAKPKLQAVVLQMVLMELQRINYSDFGTGKRTITVVDEAADLLQMEGPARFAERMARQARKYNAALWVVSQLLSDFIRKIPTGPDILGNSAFKFLMSQKSEVIQELRKENWAGLSPYDVQMLEAVHTEEGAYSESLYITPRGSGVGRLVLPREHQLMYTTKPAEKEQIKTFTDQGMSTIEAIRAVAAAERVTAGTDGMDYRKSA